MAGAVAAVLHVPLALAHAGASLPLALVLLVMALVCLPCAGHLWRAPSPRTWRAVALAGSLVLVAHAALLLAPPLSVPSPGVRLDVAGSAGHAGHATALGGTAAWHSPALLAVVSALTAAQVVACLVLLERSRRPSGATGASVTMTR
ncbi:hypothetical protein GCM10009528_17100 [Kineococcus aurantiacus]